MESKKSFETIINNFENKYVMVIGDVMLDHYIFGKSNKRNPEHIHAPLVDVEEHKYLLGAAGNVANNINRLGANVYLAGVAGNVNDYRSDIISRICNRDGIDGHFFTTASKTITKNRLICGGEQIARFDEDKGYKIDDEVRKSMLEAINHKLDNKKVDAILFSDYNKGTLDKSLVQNIIKKAKKKDIKVYSAIKPANAEYFRGSTVACCNAKEAEEYTKKSCANGNLQTVGKKFVNDLDLEYAVITLSERGMFSYSKDGKYEVIPTRARSVADVTSAGDTVISLLSLTNLELNIHDSAELANIAAGKVVEKVGTYAISREELIGSLSTQ